ncbi:unnamed protein product [Sphagnum troendelagicum]|uniref:Allene oxide synthase n=1 Tax=Sphagnum troendelagicum TaxID=128251 RepID=A0ABP0U129_9BRYO
MATSTKAATGDSDDRLPLKKIPGTYGAPFFGAVKDRLDYFWFQGVDTFFKSRMDEYKSTVYRVNMPPGPPGFPDPRVIVLLDQKSFPVLFDTSLVEKKDVFLGTYRPSLSFTGGYRVLPYLDPSEERHTKLKTFCFNILKDNGPRLFSEFSNAIGDSFIVWETALEEGGTASFSTECAQFAFNFLFRGVVHRDPVAPGEASLGTKGGEHASLWTAPQLAPVASLGLPHAIEELTVHSFPLPFILVKSQYDPIFKFITTYATDALGKAEALGIDRNDAANNLLFFLSFNAFGGFNIFFPAVVREIAGVGPDLMRELVSEVKDVLAATGENKISLQSLGKMSLVTSVVYECFRINPPVPFQYGRAKKDFILESHDASFEIKKGEMLFGYQPFVTNDPKVFADPGTFNPKRFLGPEGEKLISSVFWSNGRETDSPTLQNKQCAGKDLVVTISRLFVAELFNRYESFELAPKPAGPAGPTSQVTFTSLIKNAKT